MINDSIISNWRNMVAGVNEDIPLPDGRMVPGINLDNAATTPPLNAVMEAICELAPLYSSIHRGTGYKSAFTTEFYEKSRVAVASLVNADLNNDSLIYVKNTTEAINKLSNLLYEVNSRQIILTTEMDHHSNILPWRTRFKTESIRIDASGRLSMEDLTNKLRKHDGKVGLVAVTGASNVTGYTIPIHEIASICHSHGAEIAVDGAQLVPHCSLDMYPKTHIGHIDFLSFSAHKMYAPFGTGVLIGPKKVFEKIPPDYSGGGTVKVVTTDSVVWADTPEKHEAGTPNVLGVAALVSAIRSLSDIGMHNISRYENELLETLIIKLSAIPDIILYRGGCSNSDKNASRKFIEKSPPRSVSKYDLKQTGRSYPYSPKEIDIKHQIGILPFNIRGMHHETVAKALAYEFGISVRSGCFCAHPYVQKLLGISNKKKEHLLKHPNSEKPGMIRISFGFYNTLMEIDILTHCLVNIIDNKNEMIRKYQAAP